MLGVALQKIVTALSPKLTFTDLDSGLSIFISRLEKEFYLVDY